VRKGVDELIRIASHGGGLRLKASEFSTDDLVRIASYSATSASRLEITAAGSKSVDDLVRIANSGKGAVLFEFE
jgi:hypothetical protein